VLWGIGGWRCRVDVEGLVDLVARGLSEGADPAKAVSMAAYMKTDTPFYGAQKAARIPVHRQAIRRFPPADRSEYRQAVLALWNQPHREERYLAIDYACSFPRYIIVSSVPLYRRMIVEGAWWDFVDSLAIHLVGQVLLNQRDATAPKVRAWIDDPNMWLRRSAIIGQITHKQATDTDLLFEACARRMHETEFFIRKAIGWALRDYAKTNPSAVVAFVMEYRDELSGLSFREATKHLDV
jgi:3-methyladenine DNA glycosylase AlkD